jgi:DNA repair protein RecO (recombination protein O)
MSLQTIEGIVIRAIDYGETHKILTLYTTTHGKISCMVRGVKKPQSRLSALAHVFTHATFFIVFGRQGMGRIEQGEVIKSYRSIREDLMATAYATYAVELLDRASEGLDPSFSLFRILQATLDQIGNGQDPEIVCRIVETKSLQLQGVEPILSHCVRCGRQERSYHVISLAEGGVICSNCAIFDKSGIIIDEKTWKLLILFRQVDLSRLGNVSIRPHVRQELQQILWYFIEQHAGIHIRSRRFLEQMERFLPSDVRQETDDKER